MEGVKMLKRHKTTDFELIIDHNEKDGGCASYQYALRSEIV